MWVNLSHPASRLRWFTPIVADVRHSTRPSCIWSGCSLRCPSVLLIPYEIARVTTNVAPQWCHYGEIGTFRFTNNDRRWWQESARGSTYRSKMPRLGHLVRVDEVEAEPCCTLQLLWFRAHWAIKKRWFSFLDWALALLITYLHFVHLPIALKIGNVDKSTHAVVYCVTQGDKQKAVIE